MTQGPDADVPLDAFDQAPDVTATDESAADQTTRIAEENAGTAGTTYTVSAGMRMERDGVILEAGATLQFRPSEVAAGVPAALVAAGIIH